jgi:hypothetical protein
MVDDGVGGGGMEKGDLNSNAEKVVATTCKKNCQQSKSKQKDKIKNKLN